jgi:hypothetical protein
MANLLNLGRVVFAILWVMGKLFNLRHILMVVLIVHSAAFAVASDDAKPGNPSDGSSIENKPSDDIKDPANVAQAGAVLNADSKNANAAVVGFVAESTEEGRDPKMLEKTRAQMEPPKPPEALLAKLATFEKAEKEPNALNIVNTEWDRLNRAEQEKHEKDGWFKTANMKFAPESMTFFVAIGLVTYNSIWIKSHGDPMAMERHILSLKDPIAHISFYSFMAANGFYMNLKAGAMDVATKMQSMRRLSYEGMAIGSLASSIVSDLGQSGKMCVDYWILGHNDQSSVAACTQAWKHWTARNKFQQYFPQVIGMWASQAATELIDSNARAKFQQITATETIKKLFQSKYLVSMAKKITAANVTMEFVGGVAGGTWAMRGVRWLGKLTQFYMFVSVDHALSPYTYRPLNNLIRPLFADLDFLAINNLFNVGEKINWDDSRIGDASKVVCTADHPNCFDKKVISEIENFGEQMQQWREHLNSEAETDMAGWMEMTKRLLSQIDYSYKFYKSFVSSLFETLNTGYQIQKGELKPSAATIISQFPGRKLPLYGINTGAYKPTGGQVEDLYLNGTAELEKIQKGYIGNSVKIFEIISNPDSRKNIPGDLLTQLNSLLAKLLAVKTEEQLNTGLDAISQLLSVDPEKNPSSKTYNSDLLALLNAFGEIISNPMKKEDIDTALKMMKFLENLAQTDVQKSIQGDSQTKLNSIITKLKSPMPEVIGSGLIEINQALGVNSMKDPSGKTYSSALLTLLTNFRNLLGNPLPVMYPFASLTQAFTANSSYASTAADANFSLWSVRNKYMFNKDADLMTYKIFCGPAEGSLDKFSLKLFGIGNAVDILAPQFNPPRLLNKSKDLDDYCSQWRKTRELKVFEENLYVPKIGNSSMYAFFIANFNYNVSGDFRDKSNSSTFDKWWLANGRKSLDVEFKNYDQQFKRLVELTEQNIFDNKSFYNWLVDHLNQSKYLKSNIKENLQFETNFYLQIISRMLEEGKVSPLKNKFSYMESISKQATDEKFKAVMGQSVRPEIQKVQDLLNSYYPFILQQTVQFDQYIAHSKKIDRAINELLVLAKLKKYANKSGPPLESNLLTSDTKEKEEPMETLSLSADEKTQLTSSPSGSGTETTDEVGFEDVQVKPNFRQKAITAAVKGLRDVESEIRRFIRMKISLAQTLELDTKEFMDDFKNQNSHQNEKKTSLPVNANPFGQGTGA